MNSAAPEPEVGLRRRAALAAAFVWGFAEATIFFILPDVLLTRLALYNVRRALLSCWLATAGAVLGGALLWYLGQEYPGRLFRTFEYLPGIHLHLLLTTGNALHEDGLLAVVRGALSGQPYKLYAVHAAGQGIGLVGFLGVSIIARLLRFVAVTLLAAMVGRLLGARSLKFRFRVHGWAWFAYYAVYFWQMR